MLPAWTARVGLCSATSIDSVLDGHLLHLLRYGCGWCISQENERRMGSDGDGQAIHYHIAASRQCWGQCWMGLVSGQHCDVRETWCSEKIVCQCCAKHARSTWRGEGRDGASDRTVHR